MSSPRQEQSSAEAEEAGMLWEGQAAANGPVERLARAAVLVAMVIAATLLVALGVIMLAPGGPSSSAGAKGEGVVDLIISKGQGCSISGDDCNASRCCAQPGYQCYRKNDNWSSCLHDCREGKVLKGDSDQKPWSCEKLGSRTSQKSESPGGSDSSDSVQDVYEDAYCPTFGANCTAARCCAEPGFQCYRKNENWAGCMLNCSKGKVLKGDADPTPWSCEELGPRSFKPASGEYDYCASRGEDCRSMSCCAGAQDSCYMKDSEWGSCMPSCTPAGNWTKGWSCEKLY